MRFCIMTTMPVLRSRLIECRTYPNSSSQSFLSDPRCVGEERDLNHGLIIQELREERTSAEKIDADAIFRA